jgi:hypothetical protein
MAINERLETLMFALAAAIVLFLHGVGLLDNGNESNWLVIGLSLWALHFAFSWALPWGSPWDRK